MVEGCKEPQIVSLGKEPIAHVLIDPPPDATSDLGDAGWRDIVHSRDCRLAVAADDDEAIDIKIAIGGALERRDADGLLDAQKLGRLDHMYTSARSLRCVKEVVRGFLSLRAGTGSQLPDAQRVRKRAIGANQIDRVRRFGLLWSI